MGFSLKSLFGSKPDVPLYPDATTTLKQTTQSNLANVLAATELAQKVNDANQEAVLRQMRKSLGVEMVDEAPKKISDIISKNLRGEIPSDISEQIRNNVAASSLAGGFGGSAMGRNLLARDLGLTSYEIQQEGISSFENWLANGRANLTTPIFDVSNMFMSPAQGFTEASNRWNRDWLAEKIEAAPDPGARGIFDTSMEVLGMVMSIYGGGAGYKNTYQPNYDGGASAYLSGTQERGSGFNFFGGDGAGGRRVGYGRFGVGRQKGGGFFLGRNPGPG